MLLYHFAKTWVVLFIGLRRYPQATARSCNRRSATHR